MRDFKKRLPGAQNSHEIELRELQNPSEKQLYRDTASDDAFEPPLLRKLTIFERFWGPKMESISPKKRSKFDGKKQLIFGSDF